MKDKLQDDSISTDDIAPKNSKDKKCAPHLSFSKGSCLPVEILVDMANAYNSEFPNKKIKTFASLESLNPKKYKKILIKQFGERLKDVCDSQRCWVKQKFTSNMKKELHQYAKKHSFRPSGPSGKFTWLNTFNINEVMEQYELKYKDFSFIGAVPIDFDDLPQLGIKDINLSDLMKNNKTKLGFVFNLDEHYKSGSHWVGMYSDLKQGEVLFFDSYGVEPDKRIRKLMRRIARFCKDNSQSVNVKHNKVRHQYKNSECGVYSINFILRLLRGDTFEEITNNITTDSDINRCRSVYFQ